MCSRTHTSVRQFPTSADFGKPSLPWGNHQGRQRRTMEERGHLSISATFIVTQRGPVKLWLIDVMHSAERTVFLQHHFNPITALVTP